MPLLWEVNEEFRTQRPLSPVTRVRRRVQALSRQVTRNVELLSDL